MRYLLTVLRLTEIQKQETPKSMNCNFLLLDWKT